MARRTVNVTLKFSMVLDDDREGLPYLASREPSRVILDGFKSTRGLVEIRPGAKLDMRLDRTSSAELRKRDRVRRANAR